MAYYKKPIIVRPKRKFVRKPARKYAKKTSMTKLIKKVINKQAETKVLQYSGSLNARSITSLTTPTIFSSTCMFLTPQGGTISGVTQGYPILGNGIGQDQRIGDAVRIKGQYIDFLLQANPYNASFNANPRAQLITVWVVKPKVRDIGGLDIARIQSGSSTAIFYENQTNADSGMIGTLFDTIRKVDKDNFEVVYKREYKLGYQGSLNTSNVVTTLGNNDFNSFYKGRIKIKGYNWKVDRLEVPTCQPMFLFVSASPADGTGNNTADIVATFTFNNTIYYNDI